MKWFKHKATSLNNSDIFESIERFGPEAYLVFFGTLELMADEFDVLNPGICRISTKKLTKNLQLSRQKTVKILKFFHEKERIFLKDEGNYLTLNCPKLAELTDEYTTKLLNKVSGQTPDDVGTNSGIEAEAEAEAEKDIAIKAGNERFALPTSEEINEGSKKKILEAIESLCKYLYESSIFSEAPAFKGLCFKHKANLRAVAHTFTRCIAKKPDNPWAYCVAIMKKEDGNFNARDYQKSTG